MAQRKKTRSSKKSAKTSVEKGKKFEDEILSLLESVGFEFKRVTTSDDLAYEIKSLKDGQFLQEPINPTTKQRDFVIRYKGKFILLEAQDRAGYGLNDWVDDQIARADHWLADRQIAGNALHGTVLAYSARRKAEPSEKFKDFRDQRKIFFLTPELQDKFRALAEVRDDKSELIHLFAYTVIGFREPAPPPVNLWALKLQQRKTQVYLLAATAADLALMVDIHPITKNGSGYQRYYQKSRLKHIKAFIESDNGFWANTIIIGVSKDQVIEKDVTPKKVSAKNLNTVLLELKNEPSVLRIVDGQHRFFATLASAQAAQVQLPIAMVIFPTSELEQYSFLRINSAQVKLKPSHQRLLYSKEPLHDLLLKGASEESRDAERCRIWASSIITELNKSGFFKGRFSDNVTPGRAEAGTIKTTALWGGLQRLLAHKESPYTRQVTQQSPSARAYVIRDIKLYFEAIHDVIRFDQNMHVFTATNLQAFLTVLLHLKDEIDHKFTAEALVRILKPWSYLPWEKFDQREFRGGGGARDLAGLLIAQLAKKRRKFRKFPLRL